MDPLFLRHFACRLRVLMAVARSDATKRQLAVWIDEFERYAADLEQQRAATEPSSVPDRNRNSD